MDAQHNPRHEGLAELTQAFDWTTTPLGPREHWPQSLRTAVSIMLTSRYPMWMGWGPELTFLYNDAYAEMTLGKKHPWALGKPAQIVWAEIWPDIGPLIDHVLETGEATWSEGLLLLLERAGYPEETYHTFSYSPLHDNNGATAGMFCVVAEETGRVIGQRRLASLANLAASYASALTEEEAIQATLSSLALSDKDIPFAQLFIYDDDGAPVAASSQKIKDTNTSTNDTLFLLPQATLSDRLAKNPVLRLEQPETWPKGGWDKAPTEAAVISVPGQAAGQPAGYLIAGLNPYRVFDSAYESFLELMAGQISAKLASARAFEQERKRNEALAQLDHAKTTFFSNVSHEFRTPLSLMLGPLEQLLQNAADIPEKTVSLLELAHRNSTRLLKLVNALLDFTRIESGRATAHFEPVDLCHLTTDLVSNFRAATDKAGLELIVRCAELPSTVQLDRDMWEKIVLNLLSNAFKFTLEGRIEVSVDNAPDGKSAVLAIKDTGVGIPAHEIHRVFERFHRIADQPGRSFEGSGIGLALVQELVKLHGGTISVASELGLGTTFTVQIPYGSAQPASQDTPSPATGSTQRVDDFVNEALRWLPDDVVDTRQHERENQQDPLPYQEERATVLIVDDNADMRSYLTRLLSGHWNVVTASNGMEALAAIEQNPPQIILSDVMMPIMDGFELIQRLRADLTTRSIPVLLLSARAGEEARIEGLRAGADDYLTKPFSARELIARVEANLKLVAVRKQGDARVQGILESITDGFHVIDAEGRFTSFNKAAEGMFAAHGVVASELIGSRIFTEAFPDARDSSASHAIMTALIERKSTEGESYYAPWKQWFSLRNYPTPDGGVATFFQNITERKRAETQQKLLTNELNHRVKNTLAIIQSIANQTLRDVPDPAQFKVAFTQRLMALSRAHNLLTQKSWTGATLEEVATAALAPFRQTHGESRITLTGSPQHLSANSAVSMVLALHELATNAVKYGSLSNETGTVHLQWDYNAKSGEIVAEWRESGGPAVTEPTRRGFGRRLIESSADQLGGAIDLLFHPDGVVCQIKLPPATDESPH